MVREYRNGRHKSEMYLFVRDPECRRPDYQVNAFGELWQFNGDHDRETGSVPLAVKDVRELLARPLTKTALSERCHALYQRKQKIMQDHFLPHLEQAELADLLDQAWQTL